MTLPSTPFQSLFLGLSGGAKTCRILSCTPENCGSPAITAGNIMTVWGWGRKSRASEGKFFIPTVCSSYDCFLKSLKHMDILDVLYWVFLLYSVETQTWSYIVIKISTKTCILPLLAGKGRWLSHISEEFMSARLRKPLCFGCDLLGAEELEMRSIFAVVVSFVWLHPTGNNCR